MVCNKKKKKKKKKKKNKKKNAWIVWWWDGKIRPLGSPFVITRQASWCQTVVPDDFLFTLMTMLTSAEDE